MICPNTVAFVSYVFPSFRFISLNRVTCVRGIFKLRAGTSRKLRGAKLSGCLSLSRSYLLQWTFGLCISYVCDGKVRHRVRSVRLPFDSCQQLHSVLYLRVRHPRHVQRGLETLFQVSVVCTYCQRHCLTSFLLLLGF